jgi:BirA family transcriptional regulator, biotin operon repressor / biotin---[acetyl-CoA-carboxylase] ligase
MQPSLIGSQIIRLNSVDSTNDYLKQNAKNLSDGALVVAKHQTAGRGRRGRRWLGNEGESLLLSFIISPSIDPAQMSLHLMWPAIAIINALESFDVHAGLKWPNDILIAGRKIGGILAESSSAKKSVKMIVGIGLNVHQKISDFPEDISEKAGSIFSQTKKTVDADELLSALVDQLNTTYSQVKAGKESFVHQKWLENCCHLNKSVTVITENDTKQGLFLGIDENGFALIENNTGIHRIISFKNFLLKEDLCC